MIDDRVSDLIGDCHNLILICVVAFDRSLCLYRFVFFMFFLIFSNILLANKAFDLMFESFFCSFHDVSIYPVRRDMGMKRHLCSENDSDITLNSIIA